MSRVKRVFLIVLDSVGAGEAPDAKEFGDVGAHTLRSVFNTGILNIPTLQRLGIGNIDGLDFLGGTDTPLGCVARMTERSAGKDTTIGHWEIAGHIRDTQMPTFPNGFPKSIIETLSKAWGRGVLCNLPYSGTVAINDYGEEHMRSGKLIVYTSADSVLQIAAHTDIVPLNELYDCCRIAREVMSGQYGVGRIIARPFDGAVGSFKRTADRRDFSIKPPRGLLCEELKLHGKETIAVGKIYDIFAGEGFTGHYHTSSNDDGMSMCTKIAKTDFNGLCFVNLVDFDTLWGHRRDPINYAKGLNSFDAWLKEFIMSMKEDDVLFITADHGCDPSFKKTTDHTREYTPCIIYGKEINPHNLGTRDTFADIAATISKLLEVPIQTCGISML